MSKRIVITGGAGFIGSHAAEEFLAAGYDAIVLDNLRTGSRENLAHMADKIQFIEGDIRDRDLLAKTLQKGDTVLHLAAFVSVPESIQKPEEAHDLNVNGSHTLYIVANEAGVARVITASSAAIYGNPVEVPIDEDHRKEFLSPYALHKHINEEFGSLYSKLGDTTYIFPRFFNVYGPRQSAKGGYAAVIPIFAEKISANEPAVIDGDGSAVRDFVYVKDVAKSLLRAAEANLGDVKFVAFNIGSGKPVTVKDVWNTLCQIHDKEIPPVHGPKRAGDIDVSLADVSRTKELLSFEAETGFEEGLRRLFK